MSIFRRKKYAWVDLMEKMITQPELYDREYREIDKRNPELGHKLHNLRFVLDFMYIRRAYFEDIIDKINFQALQYSLHNYNIKTELSRKDDFFDSLITAMNMLGEELNYSTITRQYLNDVFNAIPDLIFVLDNHGFIQSYNSTINQELFYSDEELKHKSICTIVQEAIELNDLLDFEKHQRIIHLKAKNRKTIPVSIKSTRFVRGNQDETGWIILFSNVSVLLKYKIELEDALNKAQESERLKTAFLANLSHEIRTPLNGILGFSEILLKKTLPDEQKEHFLNIIHTNGERLLSIMDDLINISRIEAGVMKVNLDTVNLKDEIEELYSYFKHDAETKNLNFILNFNIDDKNSFIHTDKTKLVSIFSNLIKNAIKYTEKGSIEISCSQINNEIEFRVNDTGIGIPIERQKAVFERFVQADIEDKKALQGVGLGLTIAKSYTELLGGQIFLESEPGKGSVFYVRLPYVKANDAETNITFFNKVNNVNKKLRVLIAEDDPSSQALLKYMLQKHACQMLFVKNGAEAVEVCKNNPELDLIMMDIKMPEMDGLTATKEIRKFNENVVIVAQTAFALSGDKEKAMASGCNDFLTKPILQESLAEVLKTWFNKAYIND